ncbi:MAG: hypothetical protein PHN89_05660 [Candidatus Pacebacteria bacterium]|nr:hypothetical protein [Candidatus Paceibacterota bacterium]
MKTLKAQKADLENIKKAHKANRGKKWSKARKKELSNRLKGRKPWNTGIKMTKEQTRFVERNS